MKKSSLVILLLFSLAITGCKKADSMTRVTRSTGTIAKNNNDHNEDEVKTIKSSNEIIYKSPCPSIDGYECYNLRLQLPHDTADYLNIYANKIPDLIDIADKEKVIVKADFFLQSSVVNGFSNKTYKYHFGKVTD